MPGCCDRVHDEPAYRRQRRVDPARATRWRGAGSGQHLPTRRRLQPAGPRAGVTQPGREQPELLHPFRNQCPPACRRVGPAANRPGRIRPRMPRATAANVRQPTPQPGSSTYSRPEPRNKGGTRPCLPPPSPATSSSAFPPTVGATGPPPSRQWAATPVARPHRPGSVPGTAPQADRMGHPLHDPPPARCRAAPRCGHPRRRGQAFTPAPGAGPTTRPEHGHRGGEGDHGRGIDGAEALRESLRPAPADRFQVQPRPRTRPRDLAR